MTSLKQIRKAAAALPEVQETKGADRVSFEVRNTPFAIVADGELTAWLPTERAEEVRTDHPEGYRQSGKAPPSASASPSARSTGQSRPTTPSRQESVARRPGP